MPSTEQIAKRELINSILSGTHKQFVYDTENEQVKCRCGHNAVTFPDGYVCGTITAYPCKYNYDK